MAAVMSPDLDMVVSFIQGRHDPDALATPDEAARWLERHGLLPSGAVFGPDDLRQLRRLRAALNALIADRDNVEERTRVTIAATAAAAPLTFALAPDGSLELTASGTPAEAAPAGIVAAFYRCQVRGELDRLKACRGCGYAFVDVSKNQSRVWCDMALCGSQTKARAYRLRKAEEAQRESLAGAAKDSIAKS